MKAHVTLRNCQKLPAKGAVSVESATNLEDAKNRLTELTIIFSGDHFIVDSKAGCLIVPQDSSPKLVRENS